MIKLSFILPCYGVEKYISECLDSIYNQDISETEYEVICVNDCSPDNTRDIVIDYQKKHDNLILIEHSSNKKQGGARNTGVEAANGEYIWFIDPDDYILPNCLNELVVEVYTHQLEVLNFSFYKVDENGNHPELHKIGATMMMSGADFLQNETEWYFNGSSWLRLYQKTFLLQHNLIFREYGYFEDLVFSLKAVYYAKQFKHIQKGYYFYRDNPASAMNSKPNEVKRLSVLANVIDFISFYFEIRDSYPKLANSVLDAAIYRFDKIFGKYIYFNNKNRKIATDFIHSYYSLIKSRTQLKSWQKAMLTHLGTANIILMFLSPLFRSVRNLSYRFR